MKSRDNLLIQFTEYLITVIFFIGIYFFFAFFYNSHLHFEEQLRLFLFTKDFFLSKLVIPGGLAEYLGGFLTQFYFLSFVGPLIITLILLAIQQVLRQIFNKVNPNDALFPLSIFPAVYAAMILCDEFYPLSGIVGVLMALFSVRIYLSVGCFRIRFISGLFLIGLTYWLAGGSSFMLLIIVIYLELFAYYKPQRNIFGSKENVQEIKEGFIYNLTQLCAFIILGIGLPLLVKQYLGFDSYSSAFLTESYYDIRGIIPKSILVLFGIPILLLFIISLFRIERKLNKVFLITQIVSMAIFCYFGFKIWVNFDAEEIMTYDYLVRNRRWNQVLKYSIKKPPQNYLSLTMLNLAVAKTGQLGDKMFNYDQHGLEGLFIPFNKVGYTAPLMGNEIFYHIGLINASQKYVFEAMEIIPQKDKSVRAIMRLAETNLINGSYKISEKYLKILGKTLFYRRWQKIPVNIYIMKT